MAGDLCLRNKKRRFINDLLRNLWYSGFQFCGTCSENIEILQLINLGTVPGDGVQARFDSGSLKSLYGHPPGEIRISCFSCVPQDVFFCKLPLNFFQLFALLVRCQTHRSSLVWTRKKMVAGATC